MGIRRRLPGDSRQKVMRKQAITRLPGHLRPMIGPTAFFQPSEQPGLVLSQTSAHDGNDTSRTALRTIVTSAGVMGTLTRLNFLPVVQGSLPTLQLTASLNSSSEYFHVSSTCASKAACSLACCSGFSFFHESSVIA